MKYYIAKSSQTIYSWINGLFLGTPVMWT